MKNWVVIASPRRRDNGVRETLYLSLLPYTSGPGDTPANEPFLPYLVAAPTADATLVNGSDLAAHSLPRFGGVEIRNHPLARDGETGFLSFEDATPWLFEDSDAWALELFEAMLGFPIAGRNDFLFSDYYWSGAPISIRDGEDDATLSTYTERYSGTAKREPGASVSQRGRHGTLQVEVSDLAEFFERRLQESRWLGLGAAVRATNLSTGGLGSITGFPFRAWPDTAGMSVRLKLRGREVETTEKLLEQRGTGGNTGGFTLYFDGATPKLKFEVDDETTVVTAELSESETAAILNGFIHDVDLVYDYAVTQTARFYVDGVAAGTAADLSTLSTGFAATTGHKAVNMWIGRDKNQVGTLDKTIDLVELAIWRTARSAEDVSAAAGSPTPFNDASLVLLVDFNQSFLRKAFNRALSTPLRESKSSYMLCKTTAERLDFTGDVTALDVPSTNGEVTVEATVFVPVTATAAKPIIYEVTGGYRFYWVSATKRLGFSLHNGTSWVDVETPNDVVDEGREHDIAAGWDDLSKDVVFYVDGQVVHTANLSVSPNAGSALHINGASAAAAFDELLITEVRLWSVKRTQKQIEAWRSRRMLAPIVGLVEAWTLETDTSSITGAHDLTATSTENYGSKDVPLITGAVYVSTDTGEPSLADKPIDVCMGYVPAARPTLEMPALLIYRVNDGPTEEMVVDEGGEPLVWAGDVEESVALDDFHKITGTVTTTTSSDQVVGIGTKFLSELVPGQRVRFWYQGPPGPDFIFDAVVVSIEDDENLTMDREANSSVGGTGIDIYAFDLGELSDFVRRDVSHRITGTVGITSSSKTLTGSGTLFQSELYPGLKLSIEVSAGTYVDAIVTVVASDTSATLGANQASTASGLSCWRYRPMPGYYATQHSTGRFRLGSEPLLPVSVRVRGDSIQNIAREYSDNLAVLLASVMLRHGSVELADLDTSASGLGDVAGATENGLKSALSGLVCGFHFGPEDRSIFEALSYLVGENFGVYWGQSFGGKLTAGWMGAAVSSPSEIETALVVDLDAPATDPPVERVSLECELREVVLGESDVSKAIELPEAIARLGSELQTLDPEATDTGSDLARTLPASMPAATRESVRTSGLLETWQALLSSGRRFYEYRFRDAEGLKDIGAEVELVGPLGIGVSSPRATGRVAAWAFVPSRSEYTLTAWANLPSHLGQP